MVPPLERVRPVGADGELEVEQGLQAVAPSWQLVLGNLEAEALELAGEEPHHRRPAPLAPPVHGRRVVVSRAALPVGGGAPYRLGVASALPFPRGGEVVAQAL